jgi:hypothetical protein
VKATGLGLAVIITPLLQVTVAPLFPLQAATAQVCLALVALVAAMSGPRPAMVAAPVMAVLHAFLSGLPPGLLLLAYLPIVPLMHWAEESEPLPSPMLRFVLAVAATGLFVRVLLGLAATSEGAELSPTSLLLNLLAPGLVLDSLVASVAYAGCRLAGWEPGPRRLFRGAY